MVKPCRVCGITKTLDAFYPHGEMRDGRLNMCKECSKFRARQHRAANFEHYRTYEATRQRLPHRRELSKRTAAEWRGAHPNRRQAQVILGNALRRGDINRQPCWICGERAEAHHPDYSKPLDVVWLCPRHHRQTHALAA